MSRYAFLIGANGPKDSDRIKQLQYAQKDVELLAQVLKGDPCKFTEVKQVTANSNQDLQGLSEMANQCRPDDLFLVHFSGHAIYDEQLFLILNNTDATDLMFTALDVGKLKAVLRKCKARAKALILDCCHSAGAFEDTFKGSEDIKGIADEIKQGSGSVILTACSRKEKARELNDLDGGAGFLTWAIRAGCTTEFQQASPMPQLNILSLVDMCDRWIKPACKQISEKYGVNPPLPIPYISIGGEIGIENKIWLTDPPPAGWDKNMPVDTGAERKKYLENIYRRYKTVTLPIGPAEGFELQAIFQPLTLRPDPLAQEEPVPKQGRTQPIEAVYQVKQELTESGRFSLSTGQLAVLKKTRMLSQEAASSDTIEEALSKSAKKRIVVLGGPGSGKTTTLKYLVSHYAQEALDDSGRPVPIFLSLADFARSGKTLRRYLNDVVESMKVDKSFADTLWTEIENGNAFIAMDSLDEVEPGLRTLMVETINELAADKGNTWLVSSRFAQYKPGQFRQGHFDEWELLPMTPTVQQQLADKLFPLLHKWQPSSLSVEDARSEFEKLLGGHIHAEVWGENPLLFSLAAIVFMQTGGLPPSRAMLYHAVIDAVLSRRQADSLARDHLLRLFMSFALWLQQFKGRTFTREDIFIFLEDVQKRSWTDVETITDKITQSGIVDMAGDIYSFRHRTFQEYLAAAALARQLTSRNKVLSEEARTLANNHRTHSRWAEVLRLMFSILAQMMGNQGRKEAELWRNSLVNDDDPGMLGLELALKSLTEIANVKEWATKDVRQLETSIASIWLDAILTAAQDEREARVARLRLLAEEIMGLHVGEITSRKLLDALRTQDFSTQQIAIELLNTLRIKIPLEQVMQLLQDDDRHIRNAALEVVRIQKEHVPFDNVRLLLKYESKEVRDVAVKLLQAQGRHIPVASLLSLLEEVVESEQAEERQEESPPPWNIDQRARYAIIDALWQQREDVSLEQWLALLVHKDEEVRYAVVYTLCSQETNYGRILLDHVPIERWLALSKDTNCEIRVKAVEVLREQAERVPVERWLSLLQGEREEVLATAVLALGERGEPPPLEPLLALLTYTYHDPRNVEEAQHIFGPDATNGLETRQSSRFEYINDLYKAFKNVDRIALVRTAVVEVLKRQRERLSLERLKELLQSEHWEEREAAVLLLSDRGEEVPVETFFTLLQDKDEHVRRAAAQALRGQGERVSLVSWKELVKHEDRQIRREAALALQSREAEVDIAFWLDLLTYPDRNIHAVVEEVLYEREEDVPVDLLLNVLQQGDHSGRAIAMEVLKRQKARVPVKPLLALLRHKDEEVRTLAVKLLGSQKDKVPRDLWLELLQDMYWKVRLAAVRALSEDEEIVPLEQWIEMLADDNEEVRNAAMWVIREHRQKERLYKEPELQKLLLDVLMNVDQEIMGVAELMLLQGQVEPEEEYVGLLKNENIDWHIRHAVVEVLQEPGRRIPVEVIEELMKLLEDVDWNIRRAVVEILRVQDGGVPQAVWRKLIEDKDWQISTIATEVLQQLATSVDGQEETLLYSDMQEVQIEPEPQLTEKIEAVREVEVEQQEGNTPGVKAQDPSPEEEERKAATDEARPALGKQVRAQTPVEDLFKVLRMSNSRDERDDALEELNAWGEKVPAKRWQELLEDKDEIVRAAAIGVLSKRKDGVLVEDLLPLLYHRDRAIRLAVIQVLEAQYEPIPSQQLKTLIADEDEEVREAALRAMKKVAPAVLVELVQLAKAVVLEEGNKDNVFMPLVERPLAEAIMKLELTAPTFFDTLIEFMGEDKHWQVRIKAIETMSHLRRALPDTAIQHLLAARREADPYMYEVRKAADDALAEILSLEIGIEIEDE